MFANLKSSGLAFAASAFVMGAMGAPALAQEADAPEPEAQQSEATVGLSMGEVDGADAQSDQYIAETFGDWEVICERNPDGPDACEMYQMLIDQAETPTAEVSIFALPEGQEAVAGASILAPLETLLTAQLVMQIDGGAAKRYPFTFCTAIGCFARIGFTAEEVAQFRAGARAVWTLVPAVAPDQRVELTMSLMGFTAAFDSLTAPAE